MSKPSLATYIRALRLPFTTASALACIAGSLLAGKAFDWLRFVLALIAVMAVHLGANLMNDYADSKSGADWQDKKFYVFFGGSKLIQEGIIPEKTYLNLSLACFGVAAASIIAASLLLRNLTTLVFFAAIALLGFSYSHKPLQLSYRCLGELTVFILFGPAIVMGSYFIQAQIFPSMESFLLSLPFGIFTALILYVNEIPDYYDDRAARKFTLVNIIGPRKAFLLYYAFAAAGFISIALAVNYGAASPVAYLGVFALVPVVKAAKILENNYSDKIRLMESSKLTIIAHTIAGIFLIAGILF